MLCRYWNNTHRNPFRSKGQTGDELNVQLSEYEAKFGRDQMGAKFAAVETAPKSVGMSKAAQKRAKKRKNNTSSVEVAGKVDGEDSDKVEEAESGSLPKKKAKTALQGSQEQGGVVKKKKKKKKMPKSDE